EESIQEVQGVSSHETGDPEGSLDPEIPLQDSSMTVSSIDEHSLKEEEEDEDSALEEGRMGMMLPGSNDIHESELLRRSLTDHRTGVLEVPGIVPNSLEHTWAGGMITDAVVIEKIEISAAPEPDSPNANIPVSGVGQVLGSHEILQPQSTSGQTWESIE